MEGGWVARISVWGRSKSLSRAEVRFALEFFMLELMGPRLTPNIRVFIKFEREPGCNASCIWNDTNHFPREFLVSVNPFLGRMKQLLCLAHEATHIDQWATGRMKDYIGSNKVRWKRSAIYHDSYTYDRLPWEIEAAAFERRLYKKYSTHLRENGMVLTKETGRGRRRKDRVRDGVDRRSS